MVGEATQVAITALTVKRISSKHRWAKKNRRCINVKFKKKITQTLKKRPTSKNGWHSESLKEYRSLAWANWNYSAYR